MKKLNLPVIKGDPLPHRPLTMDEYAQFVLFYQKVFPAQAADRRWRKRPVDVPFKLK
jgi:hypothetical protein